MSTRRARVAVVGSYGVGLTMRLPRVPVEGETIAGGETPVLVATSKALPR